MIWALIGLFIGFPLGWVACALVASGAQYDERARELMQEAEDELRDR